MTKLSDELVALHAAFIAKRSEAMQNCCRVFDQTSARRLKRLRKLGVVTVEDLIDQLPTLTPDLQHLAFWMISVFKIRQAVEVLLPMLANESTRLGAASTLGSLG